MSVKDQTAESRDDDLLSASTDTTPPRAQRAPKRPTDIAEKNETTLRKLKHDAKAPAEKTEPMDPSENTEPIENAEFTEPILQNEFTDPMLRIEPRDPMLFTLRLVRSGACEK